MTSKSPVLEVWFHEVKQRCEKNFVKKAMKTVKQHSQPNTDRHVPTPRVCLGPTRIEVDPRLLLHVQHGVPQEGFCFGPLGVRLDLIFGWRSWPLGQKRARNVRIHGKRRLQATFASHSEGSSQLITNHAISIHSIWLVTVTWAWPLASISYWYVFSLFFVLHDKNNKYCMQLNIVSFY